MSETAKLDLEALTLAYGGHKSRDTGLCLMEAVAYFAGEDHTDHPQCACPVLTSYGITLNDKLPDDQRQRLKPLIPKLVGTRNPELEQKRMFFLLDKAVRVFTPIALGNAAVALRNAGLVEEAGKLEAEIEKLKTLPAVDSESAARYARSAARSARSAARSAESAARSARSAARSAESAARSAESAAWSAESAARSAESAAIYTLAIEVFEQAIAIESEAA